MSCWRWAHGDLGRGQAFASTTPAQAKCTTRGLFPLRLFEKTGPELPVCFAPFECGFAHGGAISSKKKPGGPSVGGASSGFTCRFLAGFERVSGIAVWPGVEL